MSNRRGSRCAGFGDSPALDLFRRLFCRLPDRSLAGDLCVVRGLNNYDGSGTLRDVGIAQRSEDRIELAQAKNLCIRHMRGIFGLPGLAKPTNPVGLVCLNANGLYD